MLAVDEILMQHECAILPEILCGGDRDPGVESVAKEPKHPPYEVLEPKLPIPIHSAGVERPQDLAPALERAIAADAPVVVDVVTDAERRAPEAWTPPE